MYWSRQVCIRALSGFSLEYFVAIASGNTAAAFAEYMPHRQRTATMRWRIAASGAQHHTTDPHSPILAFSKLFGLFPLLSDFENEARTWKAALSNAGIRIEHRGV